MSVGTTSPKGVKAKRRTNAAKPSTRPSRKKVMAYDRMPPAPRGSMVPSQPVPVIPLPPSGVVGESFELRIGESREFRGDTYLLEKHPTNREECLLVNRRPTPIALMGDDLSLTIPRFAIFRIEHVLDAGEQVVGLRFTTTWTNPTWGTPVKSLAEIIAERAARN